MFHAVRATVGSNRNIYMKRIYTRLPIGNPYTQIVIYTTAVQEPYRLYTRQPGLSIKLLFTRQPFKSKSAIYTAAGCQHKIIIYTTAVQEPNRWHRLYTRLQCVHIKWLFTRQPFKSKICYIHCCRVCT